MRVKGGVVTRRRHKKLLKRASGFYSANSRAFTHMPAKKWIALSNMSTATAAPRSAKFVLFGFSGSMQPPA